MSKLTGIDRLLAEQACRDLVIRAAACADAQDYESLAALFSSDGELVRPGGQPLCGREAIVNAYRARPSQRITRHLIANTLVVLQSGERASANSLVLLFSGSTDDAAGAFGRPARERQVVGEFQDLFVHGEEGWRIAHREARFVLFVDAVA